MTNYERIKNMSVEEMAEKISRGICGCECCVMKNTENACYDNECQSLIKRWLESESEEE